MPAEINDDNKPSRGGWPARIWNFLRRPSLKYSVFSLVAIGGLGGVIAWGGFNTAMEATNTMPFCTSCHEMRDNVYKEYTSTIHFRNRTGVSAACSDCHVPKDWVHKFVRKIEASNELLHHFLGTIDTPEKFDAKRLTLAQSVWSSMKKTDSRECRNCHVLESMNPEFQRPRARKQHLEAMKAGNTCIDCHKGIAHKNVRNMLDEKALEQLEAPLASYIREVPESYIAGLARVEKRETEQAAARKAEIEAAAQTIAAEKISAAGKSAAASPPAAAAPGQPAAAPAAGSAQAAAPAAGGIDWSGVTAKTVTLFYPGQASFEWIQTGKDHGGARPFNKGERCSECHAKEVKDMGAKIVSGEKAEATPIPGKRAFVDLQVQAAYTADDVYFRVQWQNGPHKPVPFVEGGKMDPANAAKLAIMFAGKEVERAEQAGCWVTCHHDGRYMPDAPKKEQFAASPAAGEIDLAQGLTKYLAESRSAVELKGGEGVARGGGDKLKGKEELAAQLGKGTYMDLLRYRSGADPENGHVASQRVMSGGVPVKAEGKLDGDTWTVVMSRKLKSDKPGDISFETGQLYTMGIALHDDHTSARFHHVSLEFRFGLDNKDAEINAVKK